ncbi:CRISPR system precrRNA processing endoribonuclease RAMP protein Cas6 [Vulcanisaeta distributa]|uniref:CRISPR system precrRNA processing endoribonuclease RAMP protein Cas6 n=1 Tax=Vulcanisaeta distributa TaxID=164451 RepID=UPI000A3EA5B0|nr:CRISPR system precrRNA processing endoribonuclease RAMP protein Cas6 [Vulcanisaeta distributa]
MIGLLIKVAFTVDWEVTFNTWCGRFVNRLVSEVLSGAGFNIPHTAREKPFTVSPILNIKGNVVSRLIPGEPYNVRVSLICSEVDCSIVPSLFVKGELRLSNGEAIKVISTEVNEAKLEMRDHDDYRAVFRWRVRFWPTSFIFRSHYVAWPSPSRFLSSAASTLVRVLRGGGDLLVSRGGGEPLIGIINDADFKGFVRDLAFNTEVLDMRVRKVDLNLGRGGRRVPAFEGFAEYVTYTDRPGLFRLLLDVVNAYGVGKNRALGLGYVVADIVDTKRLSRVNKR